MPTIHVAAQHGPTPLEMSEAHSSDFTCSAAEHDTERAYRRHDCRCPSARAAMARRQNERLLDILAGQSRTLPNIGAIRRVRALRALGYTARDLAARIGVDERNIARWPHRTSISRRHYNAVCAVYAELGDTPGTDTRARRHAQRQGWLPPIWWDDDTLDDPAYTPAVTEPARPRLYDVDPVNVDRAIAGQTATLTRGERLKVIRHLHTRGHGYRAIADQLGIAQRQVHRDLTDLGLLDQEAGAA